jgi:hypothetical protein
MTYSINGYRLVALAALIGAGSSFAACSSDSTNVAPGNLGDDAGTGGKSGSTGGATSAGGKTSNGGGGGGGATSTTGGAGNDTDSGTGGASATDGGGGAGGGTHPTDASACTEDSKTSCLECPLIPTTSVVFLNHCGPGTSGCIKFTTTSTVPAKADLPAIP